jgi:RimJ/RimL family protein N-acetyltransferase
LAFTLASDESRYSGLHGAAQAARARDPPFHEVTSTSTPASSKLVEGRWWARALRPARRSAEAEVALEVADALQGHGVGTAMLAELARGAARAGVRRFVAHVLPTNQRMLQVFRDLGFEEHARFEDGVIRVRIDLP